MMGLYRPFILGWLVRLSVSAEDVPDLCQDILTTVVEQLPRFQHGGQAGAFRAWLRTVTTNRVRLFWRARNHQPQATGGSDFLQMIQDLENPHSALSEEWDREYQRYVLRSLLDSLEAELEPATLEAFRRLGLRGEPAAEVAEALSMSVGAVYIAKSRVLRRLREEAAELLT
jgi:RNA polymerase sigma-70 factor (ECF subfamily)